MSIDKNILAALSRRDRFKALRSSVPTEMIDQNTVNLLQWFELYFSSHTDHDTVDYDGLLTMIKLRSAMGTEGMAVMSHIVDQLREPVEPSILKNTVNTLEELNLSGTAGALIAKYNSGEEIDLSWELQQLAFASRQRMERAGEAGWANGDPLEYMKKEADGGGLQWTISPVLEQALKGVRAPNNICVAAPTDKGKTSFLMRLLASFAKQAVQVYPNQPALYLVNENTAESLTPRYYQTVLESTYDEMYKLGSTGDLIKQYLKQMGRQDHVRFINIHGKNIAQVNRIIEAHKPYLVITDMTGRILSNSNKSGGMNDTSQLEDVWNCMRDMAAIHSFIHIGTVQVSAEGFDMLYPPISALQNSKVGIQTTCDLVIMMGALQNDNMLDLRGISTPKNKRAKTGKPSLIKLNATFQPERNIWIS